MAPDDLNAPLGQDKSKKPSKLGKLSIGIPQLLAGALGLSGAVVVGWAAFVNDPLGGEPIAVVSAKSEAGAPADVGTGEAAIAKIVPKETPAPPPNGTQTVTIIDGSSGQRQEVAIPGSQSGAAPAAQKTSADPKLLETTRHGAIPKIGPDGARPSTVYAKPRQLSAAEKSTPRIGIIVGSVGISASGTADAFSNLPAAVSFALAPYGADVDKLAARARGENHEVLLQVPMEPFDFPNNDPGPQTLLASLSGDQNIDRLHWLMSRFQGYVGLMNYMGARFVTSEQALGPVMRDVAKRGLIFVDDGASSRSVAGQIAGSQNLPFAKTDIVLDAVPTPVEVDRALARLEAIARDNGSAVGFATAQPTTIARLAEWAQKVESRGFVLVPITMIAVKPKSS
ncbi:divergent polysaccharide deacetylase family protein [Microbacteriaceae bacterium K1510]|nr:divergent polysaccharide deacetylase family protein [Microbacteriaceae bacterium K1510]